MEEPGGGLIPIISVYFCCNSVTILWDLSSKKIKINVLTFIRNCLLLWAFKVQRGLRYF